MSQTPEPGNLAADEPRAEQWLALLRTGSPDEKAAARRGLAALFEQQGMVTEAIDLLVANAREGYRDSPTFQALARLYRAQGDEYLSAAAALEATRLGGRRPGARQPPRPARAPWQLGDAGSGAEAVGDAEAGPSDSARGPSTRQPPFGASSSWRRPSWLAGWFAVAATAFGAAIVASSTVASAVLYLLAAAALAVFMTGTLSPRRLLRLPDGPLGDGALLFGWLLLALVAGALVPRSPGSPADFGSAPSATATPSLFRTPTPSPPPSPSPPP